MKTFKSLRFTIAGINDINQTAASGLFGGVEYSVLAERLVISVSLDILVPRSVDFRYSLLWSSQEPFASYLLVEKIKKLDFSSLKKISSVLWIGLIIH